MLVPNPSTLPKICFISGKYIPGMCGISDYIDLLREGLTNLGIETFHYPVNDLSDISKKTNTLPNADIYSLQFAPFAFSTEIFLY